MNYIIKTGRNWRRSVWGLVGAIGLALAAPAWAHAFLDHAKPKVGSTIAHSPNTVTLWFTQHLEPTFSACKVENAHHKQVNKKHARVDPKDPAVLEVALPHHLPAGTYTVIWHVVSVDTHRTQGHFQFTVK